MDIIRIGHTLAIVAGLPSSGHVPLHKAHRKNSLRVMGKARSPMLEFSESMLILSKVQLYVRK